MKLKELNQIKKSCFGYEEIARVLKISPTSARVSAGRYVRMGLLLRIKKNMYVLKESWVRARIEDKFTIANMGQTPSYISLMSALSFYEATTQIQRNFIESIVVKRSKEININGDILRYIRIKQDLYFEFEKKDDFFIATPEKALLDSVYLMSYGRYSLDVSALDRNIFDPDRIEDLSRKFPKRTKTLLMKHGYLKTA